MFNVLIALAKALKKKAVEESALQQSYIQYRGESRAAATSKMGRFGIIVNGFHKALHLGCCSSPRSASAVGLQPY